MKPFDFKYFKEESPTLYRDDGIKVKYRGMVQIDHKQALLLTGTVSDKENTLIETYTLDGISTDPDNQHHLLMEHLKIYYKGFYTSHKDKSVLETPLYDDLYMVQKDIFSKLNPMYLKITVDLLESRVVTEQIKV